ncbi:MAG: CoA transferase [Alphaproteobacteria bacterium]|nr:CoA transferase [Alphaproteobacteria bacterium]
MSETSPQSSRRPLSRFRVLDLTRVRAGPTAVRQLADWGADVIKLETPPKAGDGEGMGGPRHGPDFQNIHRNKRGMTLNLKSPDGMAVLKRLVADVDVVVENYRPDVKHRLGIDYDSLKQINPGLIYASISGFGQDGPYVGRPGFDQIAQGMGGLMSITGEPGAGPMRVGIPVADLTAGLFCAQGILIALLEREVSGEGQWVKTSLLQSQIAMLDFQAARWLLAKDVPQQAGNNHPTSIPTGVFKTSDGYINIAASGTAIYARLVEVLGDPVLGTDPRFADGASLSKNRDAVNARIEAVTLTRPSDEWVEVLNEAGVPCGPIYSIDQVFADPQVQHLKMAQGVENPLLGHQDVVGQAVELSRTPSEIKLPTPELGEHTDEILRQLGLAPEEITALRDNGAI